MDIKTKTFFRVSILNVTVVLYFTVLGVLGSRLARW